MQNPKKRLFVKTYGCQMNVYDSGRMGDLLAPLGFAPTDVVEEADLIILNTCHIREKATEKVYSELGQLKRLKDRRAALGLQTTLAVAGCVAQAEGAEIRARQPAVDLVFGPQALHKLPEMVAQATRARGLVLETDFAAIDKFDALETTPRAQDGVSAFLSVQEGCDKFCTFCVVPYTRGAEYSRPFAQIIAEAEQLADQGVRELVLLGQNVNAWSNSPENGGSKRRLADLLARLADIPQIARLRYTTSHPIEMTHDLIALHGQSDKLMPFLHLPVQSGSDRILKAMNRRHTIADYIAIIEDVRKARPDIAIATDFIVGFPGETESDFAASLALVDRIGFSQAFSFKFSPRPGTPAAELAGMIPEGEKDRRLAALQEKLVAAQLAFNRARIGTTCPVLITGPGRHHGQSLGRSPWLQAVHVDELHAPGTLLPLRIVSASQNSLRGQSVRPPADLPMDLPA